MKRIILIAATAALALAAVSCGNKGKKAESSVPEYKVVEAPQVDLADYPVDEDGYVVLFDRLLPLDVYGLSGA